MLMARENMQRKVKLSQFLHDITRKWGNPELTITPCFKCFCLDNNLERNCVTCLSFASIVLPGGDAGGAAFIFCGTWTILPAEKKHKRVNKRFVRSMKIRVLMPYHANVCGRMKTR